MKSALSKIHRSTLVLATALFCTQGASADEGASPECIAWDAEDDDCGTVDDDGYLILCEEHEDCGVEYVLEDDGEYVDDGSSAICASLEDSEFSPPAAGSPGQDLDDVWDDAGEGVGPADQECGDRRRRRRVNKRKSRRRVETINVREEVMGGFRDVATPIDTPIFHVGTPARPLVPHNSPSFDPGDYWPSTHGLGPDDHAIYFFTDADHMNNILASNPTYFPTGHTIQTTTLGKAMAAAGKDAQVFADVREDHAIVIVAPPPKRQD